MGLRIQRNISLQPYNTMAIPAMASALVEVDNQPELMQACDLAKQQNLTVIVLGGGSNTIFARNHDGLIIVNRMMGIERVEQTGEAVYLNVGGGENWHEFVRYCVLNGYFGLENLALIPGLVGAAPIQNIGAYGVEVKDFIESVTVYDMASNEIRCLSNHDCCFSYRDSCFKHHYQDQVVITQVQFKLPTKPALNLTYPALKNALQSRVIEQPSPIDVFDVVCQIRSAKLPDPSVVPNSGSFFKNPVVTTQQHQLLKQRYPDLVSFALRDTKEFKLAAAWLIEKAGWKQRAINGINVYRDQALVITNTKRKDGESVMHFARTVQADVKQMFGVALEIEPRVFG